MIAGAGHSPFEVKEEDLHINSERNSDAGWNVHGHGEKIGKPFVSTGVVTKIGKAEVYHEYVGGDLGNMDEGTPGGLTTGGPPPPPVGFRTRYLADGWR